MKNIMMMLDTITEYLQKMKVQKRYSVSGRSIYILEKPDLLLKTYIGELNFLMNEYKKKQKIIKKRNVSNHFPNYYEDVAQINMQLNNAYTKTVLFDTEKEKKYINSLLENLYRKQKNEEYKKKYKILEYEEYLKKLGLLGNEKSFFIRKHKENPRAFLRFSNTEEKLRISLRKSGNIFVGKFMNVLDNSTKITKTRSDKKIPVFCFAGAEYYRGSDF